MISFRQCYELRMALKKLDIQMHLSYSLTICIDNHQFSILGSCTCIKTCKLINVSGNRRKQYKYKMNKVLPNGIRLSFELMKKRQLGFRSRSLKQRDKKLWEQRNVRRWNVKVGTMGWNEEWGNCIYCDAATRQYRNAVTSSTMILLL